MMFHSKSPFGLHDIAGKLGLKRAAHAVKLALDQILIDTPATHGFGLHVDLMPQIADAGIGIHQSSVRSLFPNEAVSTDNREGKDDGGHV
jgi:hypothetical protein